MSKLQFGKGNCSKIRQRHAQCVTPSVAPAVDKQATARVGNTGPSSRQKRLVRVRNARRRDATLLAPATRGHGPRPPPPRPPCDSAPAPHLIEAMPDPSSRPRLVLGAAASPPRVFPDTARHALPLPAVPSTAPGPQRPTAADRTSPRLPRPLMMSPTAKNTPALGDLDVRSACPSSCQRDSQGCTRLVLSRH